MYVILWCNGPYTATGVFVGSYDCRETAIAQANALAENNKGDDKFEVYETPHNYTGRIEDFDLCLIHTVMKD